MKESCTLTTVVLPNVGLYGIGMADEISCQMPEASNVYRKKLVKFKVRPRLGSYIFHYYIFYKRVNPLGLIESKAYCLNAEFN